MDLFSDFEKKSKKSKNDEFFGKWGVGGVDDFLIIWNIKKNYLKNLKFKKFSTYNDPKMLTCKYMPINLCLTCLYVTSFIIDICS